MKNKIKKFSVFIFSLSFVFLSGYYLSFARDLGDLFDDTSDLIAGSVLGLIFALAMVYFFWGVVQYALYPDDENKKDKGRSIMINGLIALTVMFTVYALINVLKNTFGLNEDNTKITLPVIK